MEFRTGRGGKTGLYPSNEGVVVAILVCIVVIGFVLGAA